MSRTTAAARLNNQTRGAAETADAGGEAAAGAAGESAFANRAGPYLAAMPTRSKPSPTSSYCPVAS
jgi:hypothetical protein